MFFISALLALGIFVGVLSSLLGIGGGLLLVPCVIGLGFGVLPATATSLVGVILSSVSGSFRNWRAGELKVKRSLSLAIGGIPGAQLGALVGENLSTCGLSFAFAALQILSIYLISLRQQLAHEEVDIDSTPRPESVFDLPSLGIGGVTGILAGLFGVGGGVVMVPLQMIVLKTSIKDAVRISLGAIVVIGLSGLVRHALLGNVLWVPGLCLGMGGVIGAQLGARVLPHLPPPVVTGMFRGLLAVVAFVMVIQGCLALPPSYGGELKSSILTLVETFSESA